MVQQLIEKINNYHDGKLRSLVQRMPITYNMVNLLSRTSTPRMGCKKEYDKLLSTIQGYQRRIKRVVEGTPSHDGLIGYTVCTDMLKAEVEENLESLLRPNTSIPAELYNQRTDTIDSLGKANQMGEVYLSVAVEMLTFLDAIETYIEESQSKHKGIFGVNYRAALIDCKQYMQNCFDIFKEKENEIMQDMPKVQQTK